MPVLLEFLPNGYCWKYNLNFLSEHFVQLGQKVLEISFLA